MKFWRKLYCALGLALVFAGSARADTLFFIPTMNLDGTINYSWFSGANWYTLVSDPTPHYVQVGHLPAPTDTADLIAAGTTAEAAGNDIHLAALIVEAGVSVHNGNFIVGTITTRDYAVFSGSSIELSGQWNDVDECILMGGAQLTVQSGAAVLMTASVPPSQSGGQPGLTFTGSAIYNVGQLVLTTGTELTGGAGSTLSNRPNAVISASGATEITGGSGTVFDNAGTVRCDSGTLLVTGVIYTNNLTNLSKFTTTSSNAAINLDIITVASNITWVFSGPGPINLLPAPDTINGAIQVGVVDSTTQTFIPGTLQFHDTTFTGTGLLHALGNTNSGGIINWGGSTIGIPMVNIDPGARLNLVSVSGAVGWVLSGGVINNLGTATWMGTGDHLDLNGGVFNNWPGALFDAQNDGRITAAGPGNGIFNNQGTFRKSGGTLDTYFVEPSPASGPRALFNNTGLLDVQTGRVVLTGGTNSNQVNVASNAQLRFYGGTNIQAAGASFTGAGMFALGQFSPHLVFNTDVVMSRLIFDDLNAVIEGPNNLTLTGMFNWSSGTIRGPGSVNISGTATLNMKGGAVHGTLNNSGNALLTGGVSSLVAGNGGTFNNLPGAVCTMQLGPSQGPFDFDGVGAMPTFNNAGTLSNASGLNPGIGFPVVNSGMVLVHSNGLTFSQGYTQTAGSTVITTGATLTGGSIFKPSLFIQGGILSGTGTVNGVVSNSATVHPGASPGILTINNGSGVTVYNQGPGGSLNIDIGGRTVGTGYSQLSLVANGNSLPIQLNGALNPSLVNGFQPALGDTFSVAIFNGRSGEFATVTGNHVGNGLVLVPRYSNTNVALVAANELRLTGARAQPSGFAFSFNTTTGFTYVIESTTSLTPPAPWQTVTNINGNGSPTNLVIPLGPDPQRFYRARFQ